MEGISRGVKYGAIASFMVLTYPALKVGLSPLYNRDKHHEGKTAIVTGATGRQGLSLTYQLARRKVRVIMACRDMEKCRIARRELVLVGGSNSIVCRHLDLEDIDSINSFADDIIKTEPHIDILINNAAVRKVPKKELTKYGIEKNYFINFLAPFLLTFRLLDKLAESSEITLDSRIVNVIGRPRKRWEIDTNDINYENRKYTSRRAYEQSKLALAYFTILLEQYNKERRNNIYVFGVDPIFKLIATPLIRPTDTIEQFKAAVGSFVFHNSDRTIGSILNAALEPGLGDRKKSGVLFSYIHRHWGWGKADKNMDEAKRVWNLASKQLLGIDENKKINKTDVK